MFCQNKKIYIIFILLRLRIIMPYWYEMPTKKAIESGLAKTTEGKTAKTITLVISYWALLDQIRSKHGLKNLNAAMHFCIYHTAQDEELEP